MIERRARDYYDLWRILTEYRNHIDTHSIPHLVEEKCVHKQLAFITPEDLFSEVLLENLDEAWELWLEPFVPDLPDQRTVIAQLHHELKSIWQV